MNLGEKVKKRRLELNLTQEELAKKMGYSSRVSINKIELGRPVSQKIIARLAETLDVSIPYLMGWDEEEKPLNKIPFYSELCCGTGLFVDDQIEDYIVIPDKMTKKGHEYFANFASGDSMIGKGIKDGDIIIFEKTNILENGDIGSFCIDDGNCVCKIFRKLPNGMIILESANDKYDPIPVDVTNECFRIIGKYVGMIRIG